MHAAVVVNNQRQVVNVLSNTAAKNKEQANKERSKGNDVWPISPSLAELLKVEAPPLFWGGGK